MRSFLGRGIFVGRFVFPVFLLCLTAVERSSAYVEVELIGGETDINVDGPVSIPNYPPDSYFANVHNVDGAPTGAILTRLDQDTTPFPLFVAFEEGSNGSFTNTGDFGSILLFASNGGDITLATTIDITVNGMAHATGSLGDSLGLAAIDLQGGSLENGTGANVTVVHNTNLIVNGANFSETAPMLSPQGIRTAQVSGIQAVSSGLQGSGNSTTHPGGNVTVTTTQNSTIALTQVSDAITAGISASSAVGPGNANGSSAGAGTVQVTHAGTITNSADNAAGIMATATGAQFTPTSSSVALGGDVTVELTDSASISATGSETSIGIFAVSEAYTVQDTNKGQSVQGGTVNITTGADTSITAGSSTANLSFGILAVSAGTDVLINPYSSQQVSGKSGTGDGGEVTVQHAGTIQTEGAGSIGIAALSIGGAAVVTQTDSSGYLGSDGSGEVGSGAQVQVTTESGSSITTLGNGAHGIVAISASSGGVILNEFDGTSESDGFIVGNNASSGSGHHGGSIVVEHGGSLTTGDGSGTGSASIGIIAQSIGGGGGSASGGRTLFVGDNGGAGGDGGQVTVTTDTGSTITTRDVYSAGILAQSIGGGGGNGGSSAGLFVSVGGRGGSGGDGKDVNVTHNGSINTNAHFSAGIIGQSIGGGGGNGGGALAIGAVLSAGIGGAGGSGGDGGTVEFTSSLTSSVTTTGNHSDGMVFQSIGGGGGTGGGSLSDDISTLVSIGVAFGGSGGGGGNADNLNIANNSAITTGTLSTRLRLPNPDDADSGAIVVQSLGGGGGNGGSAAAHSFNADITDNNLAASFDLALGGSSHAGGDAGQSYVSNSGTLITYGDGSNGILAQSIGGGGGNGGDSTATAMLWSSAGGQIGMTISHGGDGGGGGDGKSVVVINFANLSGTSANSGEITTYGQNASAINAQSIGGGGGNGGAGNANLQNPSFGSDREFSLNLGLGGKNSNGAGDAGTVNVSNYSNLTTYGSGAQGIFAQAIGGGGGNAGGGQAGGSNNTITANIAVGAKGGDGGDAGISPGQTESISINNNATITTSGGDASAIFAQSIGGGGGNGGSSDINATIGDLSTITTAFLKPSQSYSSDIAVGGAGGSGGKGGPIKIELTEGSALSTSGTRSHGVFAQSVSDGGGVGGSADVTSTASLLTPFTSSVTFSADVSVGGNGGNGANGGAVEVDQAGTVSTTGYGSMGLFLQSIAGGGGVGADGSLDTKTNISLGIRIDGHDGQSGIGGMVTANQGGTITTGGDVAHGIFAQSIGGGGGMANTGGLKFIEYPTAGISWDLSLHTKFVLGFDINNPNDANGGTVNINHFAATGAPVATISTMGDWSHGIVSQSVGAGGGTATSNIGSQSTARAPLDVDMGAQSGKGNGGQSVVTLASAGNTASIVQTGGLGAYGIVVQSIGGGGGMIIDHSAGSIEYIDPTNGPQQLRLGAHNSSQGNGGLAQIKGLASVTTNGSGAHGVVLQSIGSGGGILGSGTSSGYAVNPSAISPSVRLGGNATGSGGSVSINASNTASDAAQLVVKTSGDNAFGIVAQSIGGGGGLATIVNGNATGDQLGSNSSNDNDGGTVVLNFSQGSSVTTTGEGAHGIVAQSIGGGGGILNPAAQGGLAINAQYGVQEAKGHGGNVVVEGNIDVSVSGSGAVGILAQTIGGGGGLYKGLAGSFGGSNSSTQGSNNGTTSVTVNNSVSATGLHGVGVFAQNVTGNGSGGNNVTIVVNGSVLGGDGGGAGIFVNGGASNKITVNNSGTVAALNNIAMRYYGNQTLDVENYGLVTGDVYLSRESGVNSVGTFTNQNIGAFQPVSRVEATVNDYGTTIIGLDGTGGTVTFTGTYTQEENAALSMDIFSLNNYDQIAFQNAHGVFNGTLFVDFDPAYIPSVNDTFTLVQGSSSNSFSTAFMQSLEAGTPDGVTVAFSVQNHALMMMVTAAPIPEPGTVALALLGCGVLVIRRARVSARKA
jgi:hypothetical protein